MHNVLFFDTETTGLARNKLPHTHPKQPMPVQLGMKLDSSDRVERAALNFCIKTAGWTVEPKAAEITGIDNAVADAYGCHLTTAVDMFLDLITHAKIVVAHNIAFDVVIMRRATKVYSEMVDIEYVDPFTDKLLVCTMHNSTNLVKATPMRNKQWKWPKLSECIEHFFDETMTGAHDALADVRNCARVYYHLIDLGDTNEH